MDQIKNVKFILNDIFDEDIKEKNNKFFDKNTL